jgi:hypothetical protein
VRVEASTMTPTHASAHVSVTIVEIAFPLTADWPVALTEHALDPNAANAPGGATNVNATLLPEIVPESVPFTDAGAFRDVTTNAPVTLAPSCAALHVTALVSLGLLEMVPDHVPARLTACAGGDGLAGLGFDEALVDEPQAAAKAPSNAVPVRETKSRRHMLLPPRGKSSMCRYWRKRRKQ